MERKFYICSSGTLYRNHDSESVRWRNASACVIYPQCQEAGLPVCGLVTGNLFLYKSFPACDTRSDKHGDCYPWCGVHARD
uniref:Uncharacterized protein n=1 Tax=Pyxicephalus adspersus TaxID=30357 RepID=A0AAV3A6P2_PYXAD|nr:TPA: hypothetical protein GDO54_003051 [Pyxicephalus adspersus]